MLNPPADIIRSGRFILFFQLEGLCSGLQLALEKGSPTSSATIQLMKKLRADFLKLVNGLCVENFPEIDESFTVADLLIYAEVLKATSASFLEGNEVDNIASRAATWIGLVAKAKATAST
jgi:hypothetical protein